jgi:hypothetical protein
MEVFQKEPDVIVLLLSEIKSIKNELYKIKIKEDLSI